jgi:hypothetical protein
MSFQFAFHLLHAHSKIALALGEIPSPLGCFSGPVALSPHAFGRCHGSGALDLCPCLLEGGHFPFNVAYLLMHPAQLRPQLTGLFVLAVSKLARLAFDPTRLFGQLIAMSRHFSKPGFELLRR